MKNTVAILVVKHSAYALLLLLFYALQTTPGLFVFFGSKPMPVIVLAISIAMLEGEFVGGVYGAVAGLLCDMNGPMLFGFNGLLIALFCIATGLSVIYLMHCNAGGALLFTFVTMATRGGLEYFFGYGMWGYDDAWRVFVFRTLPVTALTVLVTPLIFWLCRAVFRHYGRKMNPDAD